MQVRACSQEGSSPQHPPCGRRSGQRHGPGCRSALHGVEMVRQRASSASKRAAAFKQGLVGAASDAPVAAPDQPQCCPRLTVAHPLSQVDLVASIPANRVPLGSKLMVHKAETDATGRCAAPGRPQPVLKPGPPPACTPTTLLTESSPHQPACPGKQTRGPSGHRPCQCCCRLRHCCPPCSWCPAAAAGCRSSSWWHWRWLQHQGRHARVAVMAAGTANAMKAKEGACSLCPPPPCDASAPSQQHPGSLVPLTAAEARPS